MFLGDKSVLKKLKFPEWNNERSPKMQNICSFISGLTEAGGFDVRHGIFEKIWKVVTSVR